jgi:hypothetical protein
MTAHLFFSGKIAGSSKSQASNVTSVSLAYSRHYFSPLESELRRQTDDPCDASFFFPRVTRHWH